MTFTVPIGTYHQAIDDIAKKPPRERVTEPLLMGDILHARSGVPVFVSDWMRLEKKRNARRAGDKLRKK